MRREGLYPFTAVVGQTKVKQALLMALVNPKAGGLLIGGSRGSGKSTLARSVLDLISCGLVEVPLNTTEDMLFGSLDLEVALQTGEKCFMPGLLDRANGNIMYIDDVNLLRSELLNTALEAVVSKHNLVERDGISYEHQVETILLATMTPEEGTLGSQLLDRFGMYVEIEPVVDAGKRVEIIKKQLAYSKNITSFRNSFKEETETIKKQIIRAKAILSKIQVQETMVQLVATLCAKSYCAGHRADIYLLEAAKALAALDGRVYLLPKDVKVAAEYVLAHRAKQLQESPQEEEQQPNNEDNEQEQEEESSDNNIEDETKPDFSNDLENKEKKGNEDKQELPPLDNQPENNEQEDKDRQKNTGEQDKMAGIDMNFIMPKLLFDLGQDRKLRKGSGKRSITKTYLKQGRYVRAQQPKNETTDLAFDATLRAAAPYQKVREHNGCTINIAKSDLRQKLREKRIGTNFLFAVDASGSMGARERMQTVKGAIFSLLQEAYQKRDKVGMIAFRKNKAEILLPITRSIDLAQKCLATLPTGGKTPLADGLATSLSCLYNRHKLEPDVDPIFILITDGRANVIEDCKDPVEEAVKFSKQIAKSGVTAIVIDTETDFIKLGIAQRVAKAMNARYFRLTELSKENIIRIIRSGTKLQDN